MSPECDVFSLYYRVLPVFWAYVLNEAVIRVVAVLSMLAFLLSLWGNLFVALGVSVAYAFLPFWTPAGISVAGLPLMALAGKTCLSHTVRNRRKALAVMVCFIYPFYSRLAFTGIFVLAAIGLASIVYSLRKRKLQWSLVLCVLLMGLGYFLANWGMVLNAIAAEPIVWHRAEFCALPRPSLVRESVGIILRSHYQAPANSYPYIWLALAGYLLGLGYCSPAFKRLRRGLPDEDKAAFAHSRQILLATAFILGVGVLYFVYYESSFIKLRVRIPTLRVFNATRLYFLLPFVFYVLLYYVLIAIWHRTSIAKGMVAAVLCFQTLSNLKASDWVAQRGGPTFSRYVSRELFEKAERLVGKKRDSFKIACLGFYPSIAHLNGYKTVDGYWYLYPLQYKHRFRRVIQGELARSDKLRAYYDGWGSRLYLMSSELDTNFYVTKDCAVRKVSDVRLDCLELKEIGASYIFSAVVIENAEQIHLQLLGALADEKAAIDLYVYEITG